MNVTEDLLESISQNPLEGYLYFLDKTFLVTNKNVTSHMYLSIPYTDTQNLLLTMFTSSNPEKYYDGEKNKQCIKFFQKDSYSFIVKDCYIDCNKPYLVDKSSFIQNNPEAKYYKQPIPKEVIADIIGLLHKSPNVSIKIKKKLQSPKSL